MAEQNIANVTGIYGRTATATLGTTEANQLVTITNTLIKINTAIASNISNASATVSLRYGTDAYIAYEITVPPGSSIALIGKDTPVYLMEANLLKAKASASSSIDLVISYEVIVTA
tara:strand:- start:448 stop:795 length:348 start_codon:yes stop_codon:yes gene_type:complete